MDLIEETATVIDAKGDYVFLTRQSDAGCGSCTSKGACGAASSALISENQLKLLNHLNLKKGDSAIVGMPSSSLLIGAIIMYLLPLISLIVFAAVGKVLGNETIGIISGFSGLFISLFVVRILLNYRNVQNSLQPRLIRKVIPIMN